MYLVCILVSFVVLSSLFGVSTACTCNISKPSFNSILYVQVLSNARKLYMYVGGVPSCSH